MGLLYLARELAPDMMIRARAAIWDRETVFRSAASQFRRLCATKAAPAYSADVDPHVKVGPLGVHVVLCYHRQP